MYIYEKLAEANGVTYQTVERAMRYSLRDAKDKISTVYDYHNKITIKSALKLIGGV